MLGTFIFFSKGNSVYEKKPVSTLCSDVKYEITSESECKEAGEVLGLTWAHAWDGPGDFPACLHADDGRNEVFFNLSPNPGRTNVNPKYSAICRTNGKNYDI